MTRMIIMLTAVLLAGCPKKDLGERHPETGVKETSAPAAAEGAADEGTGNSAKAADFSSPDAAVKTFIGACADADIDVLSLCFSSDADAEFAAIGSKEVDDKTLNELKSMFERASVVETTLSPDGSSAVVRVKLEWEGRPFENINLVKEGDAWKIRGF